MAHASNVARALRDPGEFTVNAGPGAFAVYDNFGFLRCGLRAIKRGVDYAPDSPDRDG